MEKSVFSPSDHDIVAQKIAVLRLYDVEFRFLISSLLIDLFSRPRRIEPDLRISAENHIFGIAEHAVSVPLFLLLRQDNADMRLRKYGYQVGLVSEEQYQAVLLKERLIREEIDRVEHT